MGGGAGTSPEQTVSRRLILRPEAEVRISRLLTRRFTNYLPEIGAKRRWCFSNMTVVSLSQVSFVDSVGVFDVPSSLSPIDIMGLS